MPLFHYNLLYIIIFIKLIMIFYLLDHI